MGMGMLNIPKLINESNWVHGLNLRLVPAELAEISTVYDRLRPL